jgi:antitoxin MazE
MVTRRPSKTQNVALGQAKERAMSTPAIKVEQAVQEWGNGLAVRITAQVARAAHLVQGMPISVEVVDGLVVLRPCGGPQLTLAQRLKAFDPTKHGGEVVATGRVGAEVF